MRFEYIEYLIEIDRSHSLSQAAKKLYVTQPALSAAIRAFERELGFSIFKRTHKGMLPTQEGERIIADCRAIMAIHDRWANMRSPDAEISGKLRVAANPAVCKTFMISIITELKEICPNIDVSLYETKVTDILDVMRRDNLELAVAAWASDMVPSMHDRIAAMGLTMHHLYDDDVKCLISAENPLALKKTLTREDLSKLTFATYPDSTDGLTMKISELIPPACVRYCVSSDELIWNMVAQNMAAAIGPTSSLSSTYYANMELFRFVSIEGFEHRSGHYIICPHEDDIAPAQREFVKLVRKVYAEYQSA